MQISFSVLLCQFKKNKVRNYADSDSDCDEYDQENQGLILRQVTPGFSRFFLRRMRLKRVYSCLQNLAVVLLRFLRTGDKGHRLLRVCLRSLRILSRDKKVLGPFVTDAALLTVARHAGLTAAGHAGDEAGVSDAEFYDSIVASLAEAKVSESRMDEDEAHVVPGDGEEERSAFDEDAKSDVSNADSADLDGTGWAESRRASVGEMHRGSVHQKMLERGRRDRRESKMDLEEEEGDSGEEAQRKEAMKVLCNVVYNSVWAQERFSSLRYAHTDAVARGTAAAPPPSGRSPQAIIISPACPQTAKLWLLFPSDSCVASWSASPPVSAAGLPPASSSMNYAWSSSSLPYGPSSGRSCSRCPDFRGTFSSCNSPFHRAARQYFSCLFFFSPTHAMRLCLGGRGVRSHRSSGKVPGGSVEGAVRVCAEPRCSAHLTGSLPAHHGDPQDPLQYHLQRAQAGTQ